MASTIVPDFGGLASAQNQANNQATNLTNQANRPNQYNSLGSSTWGQDGAGNWTQTTDVADWMRPLFNSTVSGQQNLAGQIGQGISQDGLMGWGNTNLTGNLGAFGGDPRQGLMNFGATDLTSNLGAMPQVGQYNQQVINAWNALQQPGLNQQADAARQRLAAQGITNGSTISNINEGQIGQNWNDASNKAILAGYTQGNTEYNQALAGRAQRYGENLGQSQNQTAQRNAQYNENLGWSNMQNQQRQQGYNENLGMSNLQNQERAQQFGERGTAYNAALQGSAGLTATRNSLNPNDWAAKVPASAAYIPQTIYGAAQDTFNAQRQNENADIASRNANVSAGTKLAGSLLGSGGLFGGAGGAAGSAASGLGSLFGGYYGTGANTYGATMWNGGQDDLSSFINQNNGWGTMGGGNNFIQPQDWENQLY